MQTNKVFRLFFTVLMFTVCFVMLLVPFAPAAAETPLDSAVSAAIDDYIREQMRLGKIPGVSIGIVVNNEVAYLKGYGIASVTKNTGVSPQTVFDLASASKSFTALAVLLLQEDGLIALDAPFNRYIPEFTLDSDRDQTMFTVRQLLNQTSGLPGTFSEPVAYHQGPDAMVNLIAAMKKVGLNRPPGSSFEYTNLNYALLGALIERVSGQLFEDYVKEHLFIPLGMKNTTLSPEAAALTDRADGHQLFLGRVISRNVPVYRSMAPAGWVMSSAADMCRWLEMNLTDGKLDGIQIFPAGLIQMLHSKEVAVTGENESTYYGMGWFSGVLDDGAPLLWHGGDTPNFLADMILLPDRNIGIVMMANSQTSTSAHQIAQTVLSMVTHLDIELPVAPWWSSWKSTDDIANYTALFSLLSIAALGFYVWWQVRYIARERVHPIKSRNIAKRRKIWLFVLPATPWAILLIPFGTAFIILQALFGFNAFGTLIRLGYFTPPGTVIAAILILVSLFLWAIAISLITIFKALLLSGQADIPDSKS